MKLTSEQRQTVADNHGLIYWFINTNNLSGGKESEWFGIIAESLCKAVKVHDANRGELSTVFARIARNDMISEKRKNNMRYKHEYLGMFDTVGVNIAEELNDDVYESVYIDGFSDRMNKISNLILNKYTQAEMGDMLGINISTIKRDIQSMKEIIMEDDKYGYIKDL